MKRIIFFFSAAVICLSAAAQKQWTLQDCIDYALRNNLSIKQAELARQAATESRKQSQADLLPSLTASTNQSVSYSPWLDTSGGVLKRTNYGGAYSISSSWTVWDGSQRNNQLKVNKIEEEKAEFERAQLANTLQEQIAQLYVQVLYTNEAIAVNRQSLEASKKNEERGRQMVEVGRLSKADLAQLTAQRATDEYNIVAAETNLANYKLQLRQLMELDGDNSFELALPTASDDQALAPVPDINSVYQQALQQRPEIKNAELSLKSSELQVKISKAGYQPTVSLTAGVSTNTSSSSSLAWGEQMKQNFDVSAGVGVSVPLFDNRRNKTTVSKANIQRQQARIELEEAQDDLHNTIEGYWLDAVSNQQKFRASLVSVASEQQSYDLLSEQFELGLKNIVELMTGKTNLLQAQQNKLQSKYLTLLKCQLLYFYQGENMKL